MLFWLQLVSLKSEATSQLRCHRPGERQSWRTTPAGSAGHRDAGLPRSVKSAEGARQHPEGKERKGVAALRPRPCGLSPSTARGSSLAHPPGLGSAPTPFTNRRPHHPPQEGCAPAQPPDLPRTSQAPQWGAARPPTYLLCACACASTPAPPPGALSRSAPPPPLP